jgi:hypothetical protein
MDGRKMDVQDAARIVTLKECEGWEALNERMSLMESGASLKVRSVTADERQIRHAQGFLEALDSIRGLVTLAEKSLQEKQDEEQAG